MACVSLAGMPPRERSCATPSEYALGGAQQLCSVRQAGASWPGSAQVSPAVAQQLAATEAVAPWSAEWVVNRLAAALAGAGTSDHVYPCAAPPRPVRCRSSRGTACELTLLPTTHANQSLPAAGGRLKGAARSCAAHAECAAHAAFLAGAGGVTAGPGSTRTSSSSSAARSRAGARRRRARRTSSATACAARRAWSGSPRCGRPTSWRT